MSADSKCDIEIVVKANCVLVTNEQRSNVLVTQELVSIFFLVFRSYEQRHKKTCLQVSNAVRHKRGGITTEDGQRL